MDKPQRSELDKLLRVLRWTLIWGAISWTFWLLAHVDR
jgi:hypothetical protein